MPNLFKRPAEDDNIDASERTSDQDQQEDNASSTTSRQQAAKPARKEAEPKKPKSRFKIFGYGYLAGVISIIALLAFAFYMGAFTVLSSFINPNNKPVITPAFISGRIDKASEIVTAKYIYSGLEDYTEGSIPVINRSSFSMYYEATVRAGIDDASQIESAIDPDGTVTITLPASKILDVHIHPSSLRFLDKKDGVFHSDTREQVAETLSIAENDAREADMSDLLDLADEQVESVVRGLFL